MKSTDGHGQIRKGFAAGRPKKALTQLTFQNRGLPVPTTMEMDEGQWDWNIGQY